MKSKTSFTVIIILILVFVILIIGSVIFVYSASGDKGTKVIYEKDVVSRGESYIPKYPDRAIDLVALPELKDGEPHRVELVNFSLDGGVNYVVSDPDHWNRVFVDDVEVTGYDYIRLNSPHILFSKEGEDRVMINWDMGERYDKILLNDGQFISKSIDGNHWAFMAINKGVSSIVSDSGVIELESSYQHFHLPVFDELGNFGYVIRTVENDKIKSKIIYGNTEFEGDLISQIFIIDGNVIYTFMDSDKLDTLNLAINGELVDSSGGNDENWLAYGLTLGDRGFLFYDGKIYFNDKIFDLNGNLIVGEEPENLNKVSFYNKVGNLRTDEGLVDIINVNGETVYYNNEDRSYNLVAHSKGGKVAYVGIKKILNNAGYIIERVVYLDGKVVGNYDSVKEFQFVGEKLVYFVGDDNTYYLYVDGERHGPYARDYYKPIVSLFVLEDRVGLVIQSGNKLRWEEVSL